jgi:hypothetical protein
MKLPRRHFLEPPRPQAHNLGPPLFLCPYPDRTGDFEVTAVSAALLPSAIAARAFRPIANLIIKIMAVLAGAFHCFFFDPVVDGPVQVVEVRTCYERHPLVISARCDIGSAGCGDNCFLWCQLADGCRLATVRSSRHAAYAPNDPAATCRTAWIHIDISWFHLLRWWRCRSAHGVHWGWVLGCFCSKGGRCSSSSS